MKKRLRRSLYSFDDIVEYRDGDEDGTETFKFYAQLAVNNQSADTVYIVDEASMVSDIYQEAEFFRFGSGFLLKDLLKFVNLDHNDHTKKVIFIGDDAQLPPVGMNFSPALDPGYLFRKHHVRSTTFELTQVVRQKAESGVIANVIPLRKAVGDWCRWHRHDVLQKGIRNALLLCSPNGPLIQQASLLSKEGRHAEAVALYRQAWSQGALDPQVQTSLGWDLYKHGKQLLAADHVNFSSVNGMGFTLGDIFIPPPLVAEHRIHDGQTVSGAAILSFNRKRQIWGWKAISLVLEGSALPTSLT